MDLISFSVIRLEADSLAVAVTKTAVHVFNPLFAVEVEHGQFAVDNLRGNHPATSGAVEVARMDDVLQFHHLAAKGSVAFIYHVNKVAEGCLNSKSSLYCLLTRGFH